MRGFVSLAAGAAVLAGSPAGAARSAPAVAVVAAPWQIDFGEEHCVALRKYTVGHETFLLGIEPDTDHLGARIFFRRESSDSAVFGRHHASLSIDGTQVDDSLVVWPGAKSGALLMSGFRPKQEGVSSPALETAHEISLASFPFSVTVPLTSMGKVTSLLNDCTASLLASWGFSKADQARMAKAPEGDLSSFFGPTTYPEDAGRKGIQGEVSVRFTIDATGKAPNCVLRQSSGDHDLDNQTCAVINGRARFKPALDHDGQPMATVTTARVRWIFPGF